MWLLAFKKLFWGLKDAKQGPWPGYWQKVTMFLVNNEIYSLNIYMQEV